MGKATSVLGLSCLLDMIPLFYGGAFSNNLHLVDEIPAMKRRLLGKSSRRKGRTIENYNDYNVMCNGYTNEGKKESTTKNMWIK